MIKRIIEVSSEPVHLSIRHKQLVLTPKRDDGESKTMPIEDLGLIVVDQGQATYTHAALISLLENGTILLCCDGRHLPAGMLLPLSKHSEVRQRLDIQIRAGLAAKKRIWQSLVRAKIQGQAANLTHDTTAQKKLLASVSRVKSGDTQNMEAHAARVYWGTWLRNRNTFSRDPNGKDHINLFLNYGYSIARAALAREIVMAGLQPALGVHHRNRSNPFCLADDLIEPIRPIVNRKARECVEMGHDKLNRDTKGRLLEVLYDSVQNGDQVSPLWIALCGMVSSYVKCIVGGNRKLTVPVFRSNG